MDTALVIGYMASLCSVSSFIPQVWKVFKTRDTAAMAGLAEMGADKGIRVNAVASGPIWTPLIPSTMPPDKSQSFGTQTLIGRAGQPAELAGAYVILASDRGGCLRARSFR